MINIVEVAPKFVRDIKPLVKKYRTLRQSLEELQEKLIEDPYLGDSYGSGIFKVRLSDKSKGVGKSGGFRILYYHLEKTSNGIIILLMHIYNKSEIDTIKKSDAVKELNDIITEYRQKK